MTWASGSDVHDADKMSEDPEDGGSSNAGLSEEGDASLVGFGEGAGSTMSGPISTSTRTVQGTRPAGGVGSLLAGRHNTGDVGNSMQGVQAQDAEMLDGMTYDRDVVDTTSRNAGRAMRKATASPTHTEHVPRGTLHDDDNNNERNLS